MAASLLAYSGGIFFLIVVIGGSLFWGIGMWIEGTELRKRIK